MVGKATGSQPPQEITVTLASLQAPRISRGPSQTTEEPYAWESKEFLRKLCVGKPVTFHIVYCVTSINRTFADVEMLVTSEDGVVQSLSVSKAVASAGMAAVSGSLDGRSSGYHDELVAVESEAKAAGR